MVYNVMALNTRVCVLCVYVVRVCCVCVVRVCCVYGLYTLL